MTEGVIRGELTADGTTRVFRGIPYAKPPVGPLRWKRPEPVAPWTEPRTTTAFGKACPQASAITGQAVTDGTDEDCLTLNVWTPTKRPAGGPMPIMVWIHGGAFTAGSSRDELYEAAKLANATKSMIVSINYRLGALGFLGHPALAAEDANNATGNYGLMDQKAALEWVARNGAAFGGDANLVTIFGESAGGFSVIFLTQWPDVQKLVHRAIVQSGATNGLRYPELADAEAETNDLAKAVGCSGGDVIACLRGKAANELVAALKHGDAQPFGGLAQGSAKLKGWFPVVDGYVVRGQAADVLAKKSFLRVPYIIGTNKDECVLFHSGLLGDKKLTSPDQYVPALEVAYGKANAEQIAAKYPVANFPDANAALARACTLSYFVCPARRFARATSGAGAPTYLYQLRRTPNGGLVGGLGPVHGVDLVFLFDSDLGQSGRAGDDARDLVGALQEYWSSFAKRGVPSNTRGPEWPAFSAADERALVLDVPITVQPAPEKEDCDFWDGLGTFPLPKFYAPPK